MRLLVSIRSAAEVDAALAGGADIIDVKEPARGALGAAGVEVVEAVTARVNPGVPLSVALGDPPTVPDVVAAVLGLMPPRRDGEIVLKLGFAWVATDERAAELLAAAVAAARPAAVVAVAYADWSRAGSPPPVSLIRAAARAGAAGLLLDTFSKDGHGLFDLMPVEMVGRWVEQGRAAGFMMAVAGSLGTGALPLLGQIRPDVVGVRGAACEGGRMGWVSEVKVRELRTGLDRAVSPTSATAKRHTAALVAPFR